MSHSPPEIPGRLWAIAAITGSSAFMAMLDSTIANLAIETIGADFGAPLTDVQWVATGYLIALAISLPLTSWLGRRFGDGRLWAGSVLAFAAASLACALSHSVLLLIVSRFLQGLAAGLMVPAGQSILAGIADRRQLGRLMGIMGFAVALGPALGPALGGLLIDTASWRWLFLINVPLGIAAAIGAKRLVPAGEQSHDARIDRMGLSLIGPGLPLLLYGAAEIGSSNLSWFSMASLTLGIVLFAAFLVHAVRADEPLIDIRLMLRTRFVAPMLTATLTGASMYGGLLLLPIFLQQSVGQTPSGAGFLLMAMGLSSALVLPIAGRLTDRFGPKRISLAGGALLTLATLPFISSTSLAFGLIMALLIARGAGLALAQMPAITAAYGEVDKSGTSDAATVINIAQRIGGAIGAITVVAIVERFGASTSGAQYRIAFGMLVILSTGALLAATQIAAAKHEE